MVSEKSLRIEFERLATLSRSEAVILLIVLTESESAGKSLLCRIRRNGNSIVLCLTSGDAWRLPRVQGRYRAPRASGRPSRSAAAGRARGFVEDAHQIIIELDTRIFGNPDIVAGNEMGDVERAVPLHCSLDSISQNTSPTEKMSERSLLSLCSMYSGAM